MISNWAKHWKISFNPDATKPAIEILFSLARKMPTSVFNGVEVKRISEHKLLDLVFHPKLNFAAHFKEKASNAKKGIGLIKNLKIKSTNKFIR